ncbi:MAG TPA: 2-oxoacid:ferredoxin oxidoreductase subunit beta [Candidatus Woesearchaeota archaeon]|nr:MAG: 2-oxoacid:ferredoxin oxidoreductase subunit beta [Candidatus Woesearchaeota archaeon]HDD70689.1 2-oxoacid:ferredoxin oxidoreductase subunit beta [Candidatus Woesearchaeota archaeon]
MNINDLNTGVENTWCPGCGNFGLLTAFKQAVVELVDEGFKLKDFVMVSGIGCHAKIVDYVKLNSFYSLHGRTLSPATGIKLANPDLKVVAFAGDGDALGEGIAHTIFAAKRNSDITLVLHDNRIYGLTTGQFTPTSPKGFKGRSTPQGSVEEPLNAVELMLASGATFVARGFTGNILQLKELFKQAIKHNGFSFVDVLQPCFTFYNTLAVYQKDCYDLLDKNHDVTDFDDAMRFAREWNYEDGKKIPTGIFYDVEKPSFEEQELKGKNLKDEKVASVSDFLKSRM